MKKRPRCPYQGKIIFSDAAEALVFLKPGENRSFYSCRHCGGVHITKIRRTS